MARAIDFEPILHDRMGELFIPAGLMGAPGVIGYAPALDQLLTYNPEQAKALGDDEIAESRHSILARPGASWRTTVASRTRGAGCALGDPCSVAFCAGTAQGELLRSRHTGNGGLSRLSPSRPRHRRCFLLPPCAARGMIGRGWRMSDPDSLPAGEEAK